jgi:NAD(P)-dependent dehydrogenase (short-subunit alcohol dehydrogenase family)
MPPSSTQWTEALMPRQDGRVAVVTGGNTGLGFATARGLARAGAVVVLACRSEQRGQEAEAAINAELAGNASAASGRAEFMLLDVGDLASVRSFADAFGQRYERLDVLVLNAGVKAVNYGESKDGFEQQFGVNHLGHFALAALLFPLMRRREKNGAEEPARIVSISSISHHGSALDFDNLSAKPPAYDAMGAYRASKLANLLFAYELHRRLQAADVSDVLSVACHPGVTESNLLPNLLETYNNVVVRSIIRFVHWLPWAQTNEMGALDVLCVATDPHVGGGEYIGPHGLMEFYGYPRVVASSKQSHSKEDAERLWAVSEQLTGVEFPVV